MNDRCEACGALLPDDAETCPSCEESTFRAPPAASGTGELSQWDRLGWKPGSVMDAVRPLPEDGVAEHEDASRAETPVDSSETVAVKRTLGRAGIAIALILVGCLLAARLVGTLSDDGADEQVAEWPALRWPDVLAELRDVVPAETPAWQPDVERALAELAARAPDAVSAARQRHAPLAVDSDAAHDQYLAMADRLGELYPSWAGWVGDHPHADRLPVASDADTAALALLLTDVRSWCVRNPPSEAADRHDRHDRTVLRDWLQWWLHDLDSDDARLQEIASLTSGLWSLTVIDCCPEEERRAALAGCLLDVPDALEALLSRLRAPEADRCDAVAATLRYDGLRLRRLAASRQARGELAQAATVAVRALEAAAQRLEEMPSRVERRGADARSRFRTAYFAGLVAETGGRATPRGLFDVAVRELRDANRDLVAAWEAGYAAPADAGPIRTPTERIRRLRAAAPRWVGELSADPGVVFHAVEDRSADWQGLLYAPGPRLPHVPSAFVAPWPDATLRDEDAEREKRTRQHLAAHETYPGHHLQRLFERETCELRAALPSTFVVEGWATYAEDLVHETGQCGDDAMDRWVRASDRHDHALRSLLEMVHACGDHTLSDLAALLSSAEVPRSDAEDLVRTSITPGVGTPYLFGRRAIERLRQREERRRGDAFDAPAFHRRLLREGALPPDLLEEALFGD